MQLVIEKIDRSKSVNTQRGPVTKVGVFSQGTWYSCLTNVWNQSWNQGDTINVNVEEKHVNGKIAYFVLDSGASISVLDNNQSEYYGFSIREGGGLASGYGGTTNFQLVYNVIISVGDIEFRNEYKASNLSAIALALVEDDGIQIAGIIGNDIMKPYKFIIDYSDNSVSLGK